MLSEVSEGGGNRALFVVLDHDLVAKCRAHAYACLTDRSGAAAQADHRDASRSFVADLMSRDIFNSRIRYCMVKQQEFSIPAAEHFELISEAIATYVDNGFAARSNFATGDVGCRSNVRNALIVELANCFAPWYRPDDIFLIDFAEEHYLCSRKPQEHQWQLTALGRYVLELPSFEAIVTILASEVALSRRPQNRFVSLELLRNFQSSRREWRGQLPYSLRMFDLVLDVRDGRSGTGSTTLTPLGERVVDTVLESKDRLQELILVMVESEVEGVRPSFPKSAEREAQATINDSSLLESDDKDTVRQSVALAQQGAYVAAVRTLVPLLERAVDAAITQASLPNPGVGLTKKCGLLVSRGILSQETASYVEIVTARNKLAHGTIGRNDHSLLKPLFVLSFNYLGQLIREVESGVARLRALP